MHVSGMTEYTCYGLVPIHPPSKYHDTILHLEYQNAFIEQSVNAPIEYIKVMLY